MIIFRSQVRLDTPASMIARLIESERRHPNLAADHDHVTDWLIQAGELEAGIADAIGNGSDEPTDVERWLRRILQSAGHALVASWLQDRARASFYLHEAASELAQFRGRPLPKTIQIHIPEGYAHYAVFPEAYVEAAARFVTEKQPASVTVIGLRSIGTSLSAAVAATAERLGCRASSITVRPHGHPYDRRISFSGVMAAWLQRDARTYFAVVDEGPGRSGSSFAAVVAALRQIGVPPHRIVLFPSWATNGERLLNDHARRLWLEHDRFAAEFDPEWLTEGTLAPLSERASFVDISGGQWRNPAFVRDETAEAPVWAQFERLKYIAVGGSHSRLVKFAGLGPYGKKKFDRARALADAGFGLPVETFRHGFVVQPWIARAQQDATTFDNADIDRFAHYLAFLSKDFPVRTGVSSGETLAMIAANVEEGLPPDAAARVIRYARSRADLFDQQPVAIDGRMMPEEWVRVDDRLLKIDALDHHADHLFPGCQNIAWDIAATCVEFNFTSEQRRYFITSMASLLDDGALASKLPLFVIAYLAFRLGYAVSAAAATSSADAPRFEALAERYRKLLERPGLLAA